MAEDKRKKQREALGRPPMSTLAADDPSRAFRGARQIVDLVRNKPWIRGEASRERMNLPVMPVVPDAGKEQSADQQGMGPPVPEGFTTAPATPAGPQPYSERMGPPTLNQQNLNQQATEGANVAAENFRRDQAISAPTPPPPPQTLTTSAGNTFPTRDNSVFEEQAANIPTYDVSDDPRRGRGSDVPEGFTQIIRGTDVTFQGPEAGGREFRALPGMSLEESQKAAAAESPGFQFLQTQDVERQRANATTLSAEASMTQALYGNTRVGKSADGYPTLILPDGKGGFTGIEDFSPQLNQVAAQVGRFEFKEVAPVGGGLPETYMLDTAAGEVKNLSREAAAGLSLAQFEARAKEKFGNVPYEDLSQEQLDEVFEDMALLPEIEGAVRQAQILDQQRRSQPATVAPPT